MLRSWNSNSLRMWPCSFKAPQMQIRHRCGIVREKPTKRTTPSVDQSGSIWVVLCIFDAISRQFQSKCRALRHATTVKKCAAVLIAPQCSHRELRRHFQLIQSTASPRPIILIITQQILPCMETILYAAIRHIATRCSPVVIHNGHICVISSWMSLNNVFAVFDRVQFDSCGCGHTWLQCAWQSLTQTRRHMSGIERHAPNLKRRGMRGLVNETQGRYKTNQENEDITDYQHRGNGVVRNIQNI